MALPALPAAVSAESLLTELTMTDDDRPAAFGEERLLDAYRAMTPEQRHIMLELAELFARQQWTIKAGQGAATQHGVMTQACRRSPVQWTAQVAPIACQFG
jgi:hypothetical protein